MALSTLFHSINSPDNSSLSHSVFLVWILPYWSFPTMYIFMKVSLSPDVIFCGWLGLKHPIINWLATIQSINDKLWIPVGLHNKVKDVLNLSQTIIGNNFEADQCSLLNKLISLGLLCFEHVLQVIMVDWILFFEYGKGGGRGDRTTMRQLEFYFDASLCIHLFLSFSLYLIVQRTSIVWPFLRR